MGLGQELLHLCLLLPEAPALDPVSPWELLSHLHISPAVCWDLGVAFYLLQGVLRWVPKPLLTGWGWGWGRDWKRVQRRKQERQHLFPRWKVLDFLAFEDQIKSKHKTGSSRHGSVVTNPTRIQEDTVPSLALLSGLRIWGCQELRCQSQTWLGSCIAVAVA